MNSKIISIFFLCIGSFTFSQKYITKTGVVNFEASVPAVEEVAATNKTTTAIINADNGEFASQALMKGFKFKVALMEEHFNENYTESSKYPKATFKGKIKDFDVKKLTVTAKKYTVTGTMEMHGKTKTITSDAMISLSGNTIKMTGNFNVAPEDFAIEIPSLVKKKVAKTVKVSYDFNLNK